MDQSPLDQIHLEPASPQKLPVLFVGHGSPMNAVEDNRFSRAWRELGASLPRPAAILCVSAHWETWGSAVTAMRSPRTIHDFGGFPRELYEAQYPAPGAPFLAERVCELLELGAAGLDQDWGLDHGTWSVLKQMFPAADIPVVQLSLDYTKKGSEHYALAKGLRPLREEGVLIVGSGNMVHNLRLVEFKGGNFRDFNEPFAFDWAVEAQAVFKRLIDAGHHKELAKYPTLGKAVQLAVPTPEHFLPLLYVLAQQDPGEAVTYFNDQPVAGSLTMTSIIIH